VRPARRSIRSLAARFRIRPDRLDRRALTAARERIGDILVCARDNIALYDMRHYKEQSLKMVGQHGSLTDAERRIPLLYLPTA